MTPPPAAILADGAGGVRVEVVEQVPHLVELVVQRGELLPLRRADALPPRRRYESHSDTAYYVLYGE